MRLAPRCLWQAVTAIAIGLAVTASPADLPPSSKIWLSTRAGLSIGPPGGEIRDLIMAEGDPSRLYAGTANGHIFVTDDGAARWRDSVVALPTDAVINRLAVDPRAPDVAYAAFWLPQGEGGLLRTCDGGRSWELTEIPGEPALRTVALAPSAPDTVYVGGEAGVWRSTDRGATWTRASEAGTAVREVESLAFAPRRPERIYVGTRRQAYRSDDAGASWDRIGRGMDLDRDVFTLAASARDPSLLIAGTCGFLYVSNDCGDNWQVRKRGFGLDDRRVQAVAIAPATSPEVWAGTRGGIYRSRDAANSFELVREGVSVLAIAVDPLRARTLIATEELGVLASHDDGPFVESNVGLDASRAVAFDAMPGDFKVLLVARGEGPGVQTLQASNDAGRTWFALGAGLSFDHVRFLRALAQPIPQLLVIGEDGRWSRLASGGWREDFPAPPGRVAAVAVGHGSAVILAATDLGLFWIQAVGLAESPAPGWRSVHDGALTALDVRGDCFLAIGPRVVVRGGVSGLLAGEPTESISSATEPFADDPLAVALGDETAATAFAITHDAILMSVDRGTSWTTMALPWPAQDFRALAVDPNDPDLVVVLESSGAIFRGRNQGRHWRVLDEDPRLQGAQDLRMSAATPGLALVATLGHGIRVVSVDAFE